MTSNGTIGSDDSATQPRLSRRAALGVAAIGGVGLLGALPGTAMATDRRGLTPSERNATPLAAARSAGRTGKVGVTMPPVDFIPEVPKGILAEWKPAFYGLTTPDPKGDYGNLELAGRGAKDIHYIVLHDTEGSYEGSVKWFQMQESGTSIHYVISPKGQVTQMVRGCDVAFHAGNWGHNIGSIGIELAGKAEDASQFTDAQYRTTATLVRYLAKRYDIPLDRAHVISHTEIPGTTPKGQGTQHFDPGAFYDWQKFSSLAQIAMPAAVTAPKVGQVVTIAPNHATNQLVFTSAQTGKPLASQPSSALMVRTAPSDTAPLLADPHLPNGGTNVISDWGCQVVHGQRFVVAQTRPGWAGIWFAGKVGWIRTRDASGRATLAAGGSAQVIEPRSGAKVYGTSYPGADVYKAVGLEAPTLTPLSYAVAPGQRYVVLSSITGVDFDSRMFDGSMATWVRDRTTWHRIQVGHRTAFLRASDVKLPR